MRRAFAGLRSTPGYVLTDGFPVRGLGVPGLAVWKGDRVTGVGRGRVDRGQGNPGPDDAGPHTNVIPYMASTVTRDM